VIRPTGWRGIDGLGVHQVSLLSFSVFFQCKRYSGSVSPSAVRDFRHGNDSGAGPTRDCVALTARGHRHIECERAHGAWCARQPRRA
jgi:Restriction endonuclease